MKARLHLAGLVAVLVSLDIRMAESIGFEPLKSQFYSLGTITLVPESGTLTLVALAAGGLVWLDSRTEEPKKC